MTQTLDMKIRQMHASLAGLADTDLSKLHVVHSRNGSQFYCRIDLVGTRDEIELANSASLLVANIACLKDHLDVWCVRNGQPRRGDKLINSDQNVALIHDLWNVDKHAELSRPPRSGHRPKLADLCNALRFSAGTQPGSGAVMTFDPDTGQLLTGASGDAKIEFVIVASVVDQNGQKLGEFSEICSQAADAWESEMKQAGVVIPPR